MASPRTRKWIAVESEEQLTAPEVTGIEAELIEVPSETVEARIAENADAEAELDTLAADGADLEADAAALDDVKEAVDASLEDDGEGLDETGARLAEVAAESFCAKWNIKRDSIAVENFADNETRREATLRLQGQLVIAQEGFAERAKEWIKTFIASLMNTIKGFVNEGQAMQNRAAKYRKAADKLEGTADKVTLKGATGLYLGDKFDPAGVIAFAKNAEAEVEKIVGAFTSVYTPEMSEADLTSKLEAIPLSVALPGGTTITNEQGTAMVSEGSVEKDEQEVTALDKAGILDAAAALDSAGKALSKLNANKTIKSIEALSKSAEKAAKNQAPAEGEANAVSEAGAFEAKAFKLMLSSAVTCVQATAKGLRAAGKGIDMLVTESMKAHKVEEAAGEGTDVVPA